MLKKLAVVAGFICTTLFYSGAAATTCPAPPTLANGHTADANDVLGVISCINSNAAPLTNPLFSGGVGVGIGSLQINGVEVLGNSAAFLARSSSATSYIGYRIYNDQNSNSRALELDYSGSAYASSLVIGGVVGEAAALTTTGAYPLMLGTSNTARLTILAGGNVGIGTTSPSTALTVIGTVTATTVVQTSDRRLKTGISPFSADALALVAALKPVTFYWTEPKDDGMKERQIGFIAQDVAPVLPDLVLKMNDAEGTLALKYNSFIPILTRAIQQQQTQICALASANRAQASAIRQLQAQIAALTRTKGLRTAQR